MSLDRSLVLNRFCDDLLGARSLEDLKQVLIRSGEGAAADGQSRFFHALLSQRGVRLSEDELREYDARIVAYESRLAKARGGFAFKYFQYLALLYTEVYLDRLTNDPSGFVRALNIFLRARQEREPALRVVPPFSDGDLCRLAFFMATGSGKTLILHVNLWQVLWYLKQGRHSEALVRRPDGRRHFDNILLITPNEGLSRQHLEEFARSGIDATLLVEDRTGGGLLGPRVRVIEIHKLAEEASRDGVSVVLDELGDCNLVFVDEGHKGVGSDAQTWKTRQRQLAANGFGFEYSATFAQAVGAAPAGVRDTLLAEYGKTILLDYSYRHFYGDGYGKDFHVLNLARAREGKAHELLLGGLLTFYAQVGSYQDNAAAFRPYNLERPLWVFLGSSVNAVYTRDSERRSDVATIVEFLRRFLEEPEWAIEGIGRILRGESGFTDQESGRDLFASWVESLRGVAARTLYGRVAADVFRGRGGLEVHELRSADGELALRVSAPEGKENPYFGIINIGDVPTFKKYLAERLHVQTQEDRFTPSLFGSVNSPGSPISILIGSKRFVEGWSSWRVSTMGLLNMGKGEGPQVIQLFGRGVRLKGKKWTLKRSSALPEEAPHPDGLPLLETLCIFGWNADYVQAFHEMLGREEVAQEIRVPTKLLVPDWKSLPIPQPRRGRRSDEETWIFRAEPLQASVDLTPQVMMMNGRQERLGAIGRRRRVDFSLPANADVLDIDGAYAELLEYKNARGYGNVFVARDQVLAMLTQNTLYLTEEDVSSPAVIQGGAIRLLKTCLDRFVAIKEREAEGRYLVPATLSVCRDSVVPHYTVRVSSEELLKELQALLKRPTELYRDGDKPLPRLHLDHHLFTPVLVDPAEAGVAGVAVSPPGLRKGERDLVKDLRSYWQRHHRDERYRRLEVFLLRNLPRAGVGFFQRSGFYPDFILWLRDKATKGMHVRFLEPHGLHHGGLAQNREKIEALKALDSLSKQKVFRAKRITLDGYVVTPTKLEEIPGAEGKDWGELEREHRVLSQEGEYVEKLLAT